MEMTEEAFMRAGKISNQVKFENDNELKSAVKAMGLSLAFLRGKGKEWQLAIRPLQQEFDTLSHFLSFRKAGETG